MAIVSHAAVDIRAQVLCGHCFHPEWTPQKECEPVLFWEGPFLPPCGVWTWGLKDLVNCCHPCSQPNEAWQGCWLGDHKTTSSEPAEEVTCQHVGTAWTKAGNEGGALQAVKRAGAPGKEEAPATCICSATSDLTATPPSARPLSAPLNSPRSLLCFLPALACVCVGEGCMPHAKPPPSQVAQSPAQPCQASAMTAPCPLPPAKSCSRAQSVL